MNNWTLPLSVGVLSEYTLQRRQRYKFFLFGANREVSGSWSGGGRR